MDKFRFIADTVANPVILTASDGLIIYANKPTENIVRALRIQSPISVFELCPDIKLKAEYEGLFQTVSIGNFEFKAGVFSYFEENGSGPFYMCLFEDSPVSSRQLFQMLEAIDEGISIVDSNGILEAANELSLTYIGMGSIDRINGIGENLQKSLSDRGFLAETIGSRVLKEKKTIKKNLEYSNAKVLTYTAAPIFDNENNIKHVVLTGRDVSRLVQLESQLNEMEKLKNDYYSQLMELAKINGNQVPICTSKKMEYVLGLAAKVAPTDAPIFLTGESGVGKEEVARYIHKNSDRKDKPFIAINCAAIPEQLLESELFGFASGSFTGANRAGKKGLLEEANGGTFFFDEIGELPLQLQGKLLRIVQEEKMYRIGSTVSIDLDVRYISATNRAEEDLGNSFKFRRDLYYRLCVVPIHIPPLRERSDDIIPLVSSFLDVFNHKYKKNIKISNKALRKMTKLNWPGNVRELKNVVERLVIISNSGIVDENQLKIAQEMDNTGPKEKLTVNELMPLSEAYNLLENSLINDAYAKCGSIRETAKILQIDPSTIHRKIKDGKLVLYESTKKG